MSTAQLQDVFKTMKKYRLSLRVFLNACFQSQSQGIQDVVQCFYRDNGPAEAIDLWQKEMNHSYQRETNSITQEKIEGFELEFVSEVFKKKAPVFHQFLTDIAYTNSHCSKDPSKAVPVVASVFAFLYNRRCNYIQSMLGLYLFSKGVPRKVITLLACAGLSVSHQSLIRGMESTSNGALKSVQAKVKASPFLIVYDNINMARRKHNQRLDNQDSFGSGTAATLVTTSVTAEEERHTEPARCLQLKDLMPTTANETHLRETMRFHLVDVLRRNLKGYEEVSMPVPSKLLLPIKKTEAFPLPSMHINQATIDGNKDVLETIMGQTLKIPSEWFDGKRAVVTGDQLTVSRVRSLKRQRCDDVSTYHRFEWAVPVIQLFHLQMVLSSTILRTHYGDIGVPGSLAYYAAKLRRKRVTPDRFDFHAVNELLFHAFDAMVIRAWQLVQECEDLAEDSMFFPTKFSSAIKAGDVGRIREAL
ncbi:hypothetical protein BX616_004923, partial [Lobosporangium transversale]